MARVGMWLVEIGYDFYQLCFRANLYVVIIIIIIMYNL